MAFMEENKMTQYRKKPVIIEAMQFTLDTKDQIFNWVTCNRYPDWEFDNPILVLQTLEGNMITHIGDWVIKGINGEFYPCKPDIFERTYELVR